MQAPHVRETLFGDMSFSQWAAPDQTPCEPWSSFARSAKFVKSGDKQRAAATLQKILGTGDLETRHYLQAYHFLRALGVAPPQGEEKQVLGVVVEVGMEGGADLLAGYADRHARYYNYSGAAVIWERPDDSLDEAIDELLGTGGMVAGAIGPWKEARPPAPAGGRARINLLTPSGLHFGEGPLDAIAKDRLSGPVFAAAAGLMQRLVKLAAK